MQDVSMISDFLFVVVFSEELILWSLFLWEYHWMEGRWKRINNQKRFWRKTSTSAYRVSKNCTNEIARIYVNTTSWSSKAHYLIVHTLHIWSGCGHHTVSQINLYNHVCYIFQLCNPIYFLLVLYYSNN